MSSAKALASSGESVSRLGQRSASSAPVSGRLGKGFRVATGFPSRVSTADWCRLSTQSRRPRKSLAASDTETAVPVFMKVKMTFSVRDANRVCCDPPGQLSTTCQSFAIARFDEAAGCERRNTRAHDPV